MVVSVGWADCAYQRLLIACHQRRLPLVIVSDSRQHHQSRSSVKEWIKHQLLQGYSAALVAGESRAYLTHLGFPEMRSASPGMWWITTSLSLQHRRLQWVPLHPIFSASVA